MSKKDEKPVEKKSRYDDKALEYVKKFIEDKKKKEQQSIDEYRSKIQKDFDAKQNEFLEKQQKQKQKIAMKENAKNQSRSKSVAGGGNQRAPSAAEAQRPVVNRIQARSAGLQSQNMKPGDYETVEKQTRIKKPEANLAAEGAKLDNLSLKYSSEKGQKQFFNKRRVNIEKVNEKLGYFGGGILDQPEEETVVLVGGTGPPLPQTHYIDSLELEGNPFEDQNLANYQSDTQHQTASSPAKVPPQSPDKKQQSQLNKSTNQASAVKLPPVTGYKLDSLGLSDVGESIVKKSMDAGYGTDQQGTGYKNPHTRRLIQSMENKEHGTSKVPRAKSFKSDKNQTIQDSEAGAEEKKLPSIQQPQPIKEIPTYKPPEPQKDWRQEFKQNGESDEDMLPDTKDLVEKVNKASLAGGSRAGETTSIFDEEDTRLPGAGAGDGYTDPDDINDRDLAHVQRAAEREQQRLLAQQAPTKPPKATTGKTQVSSRLFPSIAKRFREDAKNNPQSPVKDATSVKSPPQSQSPPQVSLPSVKSRLKPPTEIGNNSTRRSGDITGVRDHSAQPNEDAKNKKSATSTTNPINKDKVKQSEAKQAAPGDGKTGKSSSYVPPNQRNKKSDKVDVSAKKKALDAEEGQQMKKQFDEERLAALSAPKSNTAVKEKNSKGEAMEQKSGDPKTGDEKAKAMLDRVQRGKAVDMESYLDRDVPAMTNKVKNKLSRQNSSDLAKRPDFDTRMDTGKSGKRSGLFEGASLTDRKMNSAKDQGKANSSHANNPGQSESGQDIGVTKRSEGPGLMQNLEKQKAGQLTLKGLRQIENQASVTIQRFVKGYFTRKWYINYMMRKKLGVPFSGIEFSNHVFLRQFNKPNQRLHQAALQPPQIVEVVNSQGDQKNMLKKSFHHGKSQSTQGPPNGLPPGMVSPDRPKRLKKTATPQQMIENLQRDFLANGLDAYNQFKKFGVDGLSEEGAEKQQKQKESELKNGNEDIKVLTPRTVSVALDPFEKMLPRWRGEKVQQFLEVKEVGDYLDRVSRVREYDEKQKEVVKQQHYQDLARQMKKHQISTMASFAKAQGVFNRNPNRRNEEEDDEDNDPLAPSYKQGKPGGGPPGDDGGGSGDDDPSGKNGSPGNNSSREKDKKKKKTDAVTNLRDVPFTEADGSIPLKMYQQFSREMIVFYKKIKHIPIKWMVQAGIPFQKDRKIYMPIRIFGEMQNSGNLIVNYLMNLELLKISSDYYQYNTHTFETIWPFILYLFNNWVRHQVQMIELTKSKPLFGPEEFMAPNTVMLPPVAPQAQQKRLGTGTIEDEKAIHQNDYTFQLEGLEALPEELQGVEDGVKQLKKDYDDMLNFSSEIEYDERFDLEEYKTMVKPQALLERSKPSGQRTTPAEIMQDNRKQLFQAYRVQLAEERKAQAIQKKDEDIGGSDKLKLLYQMDQRDKEKLEYDEMGRPKKKKLTLKLDDVYEPIAIKDKNSFAFFLEMHFVPLPHDQSGQYKLMKRLQEGAYNERQRVNVELPRDNVALINEERRKRLGLLPLTVVDYNCIDRAALKIKIVLECLYMRRQLNGWALVPRDVKEAYIDNDWQTRKLRILRVISRLAPFSLELIKAFGEHIVYAKQFNDKALQIERSIQKIEEYKSRKQIKSLMALATSQNNSKSPSKAVTPRNAKAGKQQEKPPEESPQKSVDRSINEDPIMISTLKSGKAIDDTTTVIINEDDLKKGLVENSPALQRLQNDSKEKDKDDDDDLQAPEIQPHQEIAGFNDMDHEPDVQDYIRHGEIFEQGIIRIKGTLYIATLVFRKIESNYENMKALIEDRLRVHMPKSQSHQVEMLKNYKGHLRFRSKLCQFVSTHPDIVKYDEETYRLIKPSEKMMLESEMATKEKTKYKTYLEVKVCTKMSDTIWDDCFNLPWEKLEEFFRIFNFKWRLHDLLVKRKMSYRDRFTFFNFFGYCLSIKDTLLQYSPQALDFNSFKYNQIFLKIDEINHFRSIYTSMPFYFDDFIQPSTGFDETEYDQKVQPYYDMEIANKILKERFQRQLREGIIFEAAELKPERAKLFADVEEEKVDEAMVQGVHVTRYEEIKRSELLVDEATKHYILENRSPTNMFNLTLTNFPQSDGLFLGITQLGIYDQYRNAYNLRIDYYSVGFVPILQIKAYNAIYPEAFELKIFHRPTIKSFIRICNLSGLPMVKNQLQSAITIGRKVTGRYIRINFSKRNLYLSSGIGTNHGQDFINMAICNENLIRTMLNESYRQFSGVMYFDNLGGRNLVTVSEFEIDMIQQIKGPQAMIHMNKHQSIETKLKAKEELRTNIQVQTTIPERRYQKVKIWKVNLFSMVNSRTYETVISFDDLHNYYETEFAFKMQAHLKKPDLIRLLQDYLRTLYIYRTKVGPIIYWRLPMYKRPMDPKTGLAIEVPPDQMYKLKMLQVYHQLQRKIDGQYKFDDMSNVVPVSMDQLKAKKTKKEPPSLSLRAKLVLEKELPIYSETEALRVLKITSSIAEVLLQRPKMFKLSATHKPVMSMITVILHPLMENWVWNIYFPSNQRTFQAIFYPSDLFNINTELFGKSNKSKNKSATLWIELVKRCELQKNPSGDVILVVDKFKEPLKELLVQDHVYNENAQDIFFMEVTLRTNNNSVMDVTVPFQAIDTLSDRLNDWLIQVRAFSMTRNVWIKDQMPLAEILKILKRENYIIQNVKLLYYSMIRDAAVMLSHKIVFSEEAKTTEVKKQKLTYDIKNITNSKEELERLRVEHNRALRRRHTNREGLSEAQQKGLKTEHRNEIDMNKIFYQAVIASNPTQLCTITYSDVKETFVYRLYRYSDSSNYEKRIPASDIQRTCLPHYEQMLVNRMYREIGERIAMYYKKDMLVASLMSYFKIQQERQREEDEQRQKISELKYPPPAELGY